MFDFRIIEYYRVNTIVSANLEFGGILTCNVLNHYSDIILFTKFDIAVVYLLARHNLFLLPEGGYYLYYLFKFLLYLNNA